MERRAQQSVETDGSLSGLNVLIQNPADNPSIDESWAIDVRVNGVDTIDCVIEAGQGECVSDANECTDVKAGDLINVRISSIGTLEANAPIFNHTVVFNGCQCCGGNPPPCGDG